MFQTTECVDTDLVPTMNMIRQGGGKVTSSAPCTVTSREGTRVPGYSIRYFINP